MILTNVKLYPTANQISISASRALFKVTGRGVHNPEFNHRVVLYPTDGLILSAQPSVISRHKIPTSDFYAGTIAIGDTLTVNGKDYIVTARPLANPSLVEAPPVSVQTLHCANGDHYYDRAAVRGRQATSCERHDGTGKVLRAYRTGSAAGEKAFAKRGGTVRSHRYGR